MSTFQQVLASELTEKLSVKVRITYFLLTSIFAGNDFQVFLLMLFSANVTKRLM